MLQLKVFDIVKLVAKGGQTALQLISVPLKTAFLKAWSSTVEVNDKKKKIKFRTSLTSEG